ncbi:YdcF family protein [uncultured Bifidobacterium sp.]|uniref:YdcF family protein n=1 Tax=uncultured Bifidobacterium sp. TaxID=165187 RepID=UPI0025901AF5|nr:YdcF family protein [uncultured Bifidobacterium sp.]MEE0653973.1 YdcF family protein [Bifidobacterium criceti]
MRAAWLTSPYVFLWFPQLCALAFLALVVRFDRRSLWSGLALLVCIMTVGVTAACLYVDTMDVVPAQWIRDAMLWIGVLAAAVVIAFPLLLGVFLTAEGCRLLRREGVTAANCLSLAAGLFILLDLTLIPYLVSLVRNGVFAWCFALASACVLFFSAQLAIYCLSSIVNLVHIGTPKRLKQIVVLGSGLLGTTVPPLLQNRILTGIRLQHDAPHAVLILSGGQGPGEDVPEGRAMMAWALQHGADPARTVAEERSRNTEENLEYSARLFPDPLGRTAIVSTRYHVLRALLLSKRLHIDAVGYGSATTWYFSLNALLREFIAFVVMTRKRQAIVLGILLTPLWLIAIGGIAQWAMSIG